MPVHVQHRFECALWLLVSLVGLAAAAQAEAPPVQHATRNPPLSAASPADRRAIELTFLKSNPGQRDRLKAFIVANWFAMDQIAKEQGLLSSYALFDSGTDDGAWNVLVAVTYNDEQGYEGIAEAFEVIRKAHATVPSGGKTLAELGTVVDSQRVFETSANAMK